MLLKAEQSKEIERELKKLKKKLHMTKVDLKHSKKMVAFSATTRIALKSLKNGHKGSQPTRGTLNP